ncbi:MAG: hypothetical protein ACD_55C00090G0003 [uncultured bacterium]|nr:MAG: hypothetical protein ACD_55C00090G0003 [uncultured bacterium]
MIPSSLVRGEMVAFTAMRCLSCFSSPKLRVFSNSDCAQNTIWMSLSVSVSKFDNMRRFSSVSTGMFWASSMTSRMLRPSR